MSTHYTVSDIAHIMIDLVRNNQSTERLRKTRIPQQVYNLVVDHIVPVAKWINSRNLGFKVLEYDFWTREVSTMH